MGIFSKDIFKYNFFERVKINLKKEMNKPNVILEKELENDQYNIYDYKPDSVLSYHYILAQSKDNSKNIYYLGNSSSLKCLYENSLFLANFNGESNRGESFIRRIDLLEKREEYYNLRGDYSKPVTIMGYVRFFSTDTYEEMRVENNELIIYGHREKDLSEDEKDSLYNCDTDFKIIFRYEDNVFIPYFKIEDKEYRFYK